MQSRALLVTLLAGAMFATVARADDPGATPKSTQRTSALSWLRLEGADKCVSTQDLARAVEERLQRKVFVPPSEADLSIEAHVKYTQGRYRAVVTVRDARGSQLGRRELDDSKCENLTDPLSLVIALMIDPDAAGRKPLPAEPDAGAVAAEPPRPPAEPPPPPPPQPELHRDPPGDTTPLRAELSASTGLSLGRATGVGPFVKVSGWLKPLHFPGLAGGVTYGFDPGEVVPSSNAAGHVGLVTAFGALCPLAAGFWTPAKRGYILGCLGMELGALRATGSGFDRNSDSARILVDAQLSVEFSVLLAGPLTFHFAPTVFVPFIRDDINYRAADGSERLLFRMSRVGASFEAGLGLRFP